MSKRGYRVNVFSTLAFVLLCVSFLVSLVEREFVIALLSGACLFSLCLIPRDYREGVKR